MTRAGLVPTGGMMPAAGTEGYQIDDRKTRAKAAKAPKAKATAKAQGKPKAQGKAKGKPGRPRKDDSMKKPAAAPKNTKKRPAAAADPTAQDQSRGLHVND